MGAEQVGFAEGGEDGEEGFGATDFFLEKFEGMREGVADGETEVAQAKGVEKNVHLMPHAHRAVLEIAVVKAEAGIEDDPFDAVALGELNLP